MSEFRKEFGKLTPKQLGGLTESEYIEKQMTSELVKSEVYTKKPEEYRKYKKMIEMAKGMSFEDAESAQMVYTKTPGATAGAAQAQQQAKAQNMANLVYGSGGGTGGETGGGTASVTVKIDAADWVKAEITGLQNANAEVRRGANA